ncbi:hypothetical protein ACFE04_015458 [Oxalis oulophora]
MSQEKSTDSKPLGICQRLLYFFIDKRLTIGKPERGKDQSQVNLPNSDIQIQFKQTEGPISGNYLSQIPDSRTGQFPFEMVIPLRESGAEPSDTKSDVAGVKKIKGNEKSNIVGGSKNGAGKKNRTSCDDNYTVLVHHEEPKVKTPRRIIRPVLLDVAANINEKSDAFIRSRKEKLSRNLSLDQETKNAK